MVVVQKGVFNNWYHRKCVEAVESPYDLLYGTTKSTTSFWFAIVLWLKLTINVLHSVGTASELLWGIWMQLALGITVCILVLVRPYISAVDERVEIAALLSLMGVLACTSSLRAGDELDPVYTAVVALLAIVPIATLVGLKFQERRTAKKMRAHLAALTRCGALDQHPCAKTSCAY